LGGILETIRQIAISWQNPKTPHGNTGKPTNQALLE
jgi:hypothetical protein